MSFLTHLKESFPDLRPEWILSLQLDQFQGRGHLLGKPGEQLDMMVSVPDHDHFAGMQKLRLELPNEPGYVEHLEERSLKEDSSK